jgi:glyoxylase-like metal-dependent hydrolase (beta-lactamase superfamily II)
MASGEIVFIRGENNGRFPNAHCLFVDDDVPTVIDPASRPEELERLESEKGVRLVINSHYHVDHVRYNRLFPNAEFVAHEADVPAISSLEENARIVGIADKSWAPVWKQVMRDVWGYTDTEVSRAVVDGDEISLGANTVRFIHTPGHTPGHMCIEFVEERAVYLADIDLTRFGPWYGNKSSSIDDFLASIERLKSVDADTWYTSHGEGIIRGDIKGRLDAYASVVIDRESRLLDFLEEPRTMQEIIDRAVIFGRRWDPPEMFEFFEGMMAEKHLVRLERAGLISQTSGRWARAS